MARASSGRQPGQGRGGRAASGARGQRASSGSAGTGGAPRRGGASGASRGGARTGASSGTRQFASRGAGRTGRITPTGEAPRKKPEKTLGGEQVEGRQAVRELLLAGTRRVREVWVATDLDENEIVSDIVDIARSVRVPVQEVNRKRLEAAARSEAPQGVIAFANPLPEADLTTMLERKSGRPPFLVAVDGVTDPGNLGALLRCCDGAGVQGVVIPRHRAVHVTPTTAKAAAGAVEHVPDRRGGWAARRAGAHQGRRHLGGRAR